MDNLLVKQFQENNITIYGTHDKPLFKAKDIGDLLEIKNIRDTVKNYNKNQRCVVLTDTAFGEKDTIFLTEQGLYKVLMKSRKPIAEKFQDWICEVVEEIRKTGEYKSKKDIEHKTKNTLFIDQYQDKSIIYLGLVEETEEQQLIKYGYTSDTKTTLKRHKETYGNFFHYIYAIECKEHYKLEKKIQKHNDLLSRHVKTYNNEQRQELIRLDKNFSIKNLINLIMKIKETMENCNEIRLKEIELETKKEETKQKEIELKIQEQIKQEETKQKEIELKIQEQIKQEQTLQKQEETKQKELDLEMKKIDLEMKRLEIQNQETQKLQEPEEHIEITNKLSKINQDKLFKRYLQKNVVYQENSVIRMEQLKQKVSKNVGWNYSSLSHQVIQELNNHYIIKIIRTCRNCDRTYTGEMCCNNYHKTNRNAIINMAFKN
jgi:prophage antirepressor-like protein